LRHHLAAVVDQNTTFAPVAANDRSREILPFPTVISCVSRVGAQIVLEVSPAAFQARLLTHAESSTRMPCVVPSSKVRL